MKRIFDVVASASGLILLWPVVLLLIVLVRFETPGPGLFRQIRVGRNERSFFCYKIRTMHIGTTNMATHLAPPAQITKVGAALRYTKLDELPQLWNVLMGEMSLVGPRPCLPSQIELISKRRLHGIFEVKPGITGLAQVRGLDMSDPENLVKIEKEYILNRNFTTDLAIILKTIPVISKFV